MKLLSLLLLTVLSVSNAYNIFCLTLIPSHSHNTLGRGIVFALLDAGHKVTWVTPFPEKVKNPPKNLKIIDASINQKYIAQAQSMQQNSEADISFVKDFSFNVTRDALLLSEVQEALTKTQFDAVITELFFNDILTGVAAVQQVPWITLSSVPIYPALERQIDQVRSVPTVPMMFNEGPIPMSFKTRAINALMHIFMSAYEMTEYPTTVKKYEEFFGPLAAARGVTLPPFDDAYYNISVMFVNAHESVSLAFTVPPNVISIAGYHMDEDVPPLPQNLQTLLDNAKQGVIYFSMGSVLKSATMTEHTRAGLLRVFASLPYTVLWKFEETLTGLPPNVHVRPWFPQPSVLAHPNVRLFITHGGLLSCLEAVRAGVPLLAIPVYGDQPANAERASSEGYALMIDFGEHMADEIEPVLKEMLNNDKYSKRAKQLSKSFNNRPVPPKKLIQHYVELAIETKGAYHLRSLSLQYKWYELWMLDVALLFLAVLLALCAAAVFVIRTCVRTVRGSNKVVDKANKKKRN